MGRLIGFGKNRYESIKFLSQLPPRLTEVTHVFRSGLGGSRRKIVKEWRKPPPKETLFELGMGPCGRWVARLEMTTGNGLLTITQTSFSYDQTARAEQRQGLEKAYASAHPHFKVDHWERLKAFDKSSQEDCKVEEFIYQMSDVLGRIHAVKAGGI